MNENHVMMKHLGGVVAATMPWAADTHLTCSSPTRKVHFVELHTGTYLRVTSQVSLFDAERKAFERFTAYQNCPGHEWEAQGYTNGAGFCKHCNMFASGVFSLEELGSICEVCTKPTNWTTYPADLEGNIKTVKVCEKHSDKYGKKLLTVLASLVNKRKDSDELHKVMVNLEQKIRLHKELEEDG